MTRPLTVVVTGGSRGLGRGLVEEVDDFRVTNPPTNPAVLDAMANDLASHGCDLRHLMRTILNSRTYQLSAEPNDSNRWERWAELHAEYVRAGEPRHHLRA